MNVSEQEFQKRLAVLQVSATIAATVGAAVLAGMLALFLFEVEVRMDAVGESEEDTTGMLTVSKIALDSGIGYVVVIISIIVTIQTVTILKIYKQKTKTPVTKSTKTEIQLDESDDARDSKSIEKGDESQNSRDIFRETSKRVRFLGFEIWRRTCTDFTCQRPGKPEGSKEGNT